MRINLEDYVVGMSFSKGFMVIAYVFISIIHLMSYITDTSMYDSLSFFLFIALIIFPIVFVICYWWLNFVLSIFLIHGILRYYKEGKIIKDVVVGNKIRRTIHRWFCTGSA